MRATVRVAKVRRLSHKAGTRWRFPDHRVLHIVDIENLAGTGDLSLDLVAQVQDWYLTRLGFGADDQVVMASSHRGFLNAALAWPHARYRVRSGRDGADRELLDVLEHENVATRFSHVIIGSGDGGFSRVAESLAAHGVWITVVSRPGSLSPGLARVARDVVYLDIPQLTAA